jgi:hypothetical protein
VQLALVFWTPTAFSDLGPFCFGLGSSSLSSPGVVPISGEAGLFVLMSLWCPSLRLAR